MADQWHETVEPIQEDMDIAVTDLSPEERKLSDEQVEEMLAREAAGERVAH